MKFYKRDPDRALAGMVELNLKQRGAYNSLIDLLYSRDGHVPDDDARVARMMACHWREWAAIKRELIALGKVWVEDGELRAKRVHETLKEASNFSQEQSKRASKRWQKHENGNKNNNPPMPPGNALTPTPRDIKKKETPSESPKKAPRSPPSGSRLPADWSPSEIDLAYARKQGFANGRIEGIAENFRDYWIAKPGAAGRKSDWAATWRTWVRREAEKSNGSGLPSGERGGPGGHPSDARGRAGPGSVAEAGRRLLHRQN